MRLIFSIIAVMLMTSCASLRRSENLTETYSMEERMRRQAVHMNMSRMWQRLDAQKHQYDHLRYQH
jgi:hypothetical protein